MTVATLSKAIQEHEVYFRPYRAAVWLKVLSAYRDGVQIAVKVQDYQGKKWNEYISTGELNTHEWKEPEAG